MPDLQQNKLKVQKKVYNQF